jgi:hypothetical protein
MYKLSRLFLSLAGLLTLAPIAHAELIYGITGDSITGTDGVNLIRFDSATPGTITTIGALSGMVSGHAVRAIDFRPADGKLYAVSNSTITSTAAQLYTVNLSTGALTPVGSGFSFAFDPGTRISMDFNPVVDRLRVVSGNTDNVRINPNDGSLAGADTDLSFDPDSGLSGTPFVADIAYNNNVVGATQTTLFTYEYLKDAILTIGSPNGSPTSPNSGLIFDSLATSGTGIIASSASLGFDISGASGIGYINAEDALETETTDFLYTVNLTDGALTKIGGFGIDVLDISVSIAPVPAPSSVAVLALGVVPGILALRRRRAGSSK